MIFNDLTTKNGAIQKCEDWLFGGDYGAISSNTNLLLKFTNLLNGGLDKTKALLYKSDGRWQDDDPNFTDLPEDTTDLSDGISEYLLDPSHLMIEGFEVLDTNGNYYPLKPIDYRDIRDNFQTTPTEFQEGGGKPIYYDLKGEIVTLFPAPTTGNVTMSDGLKIIYKRESDYFVSTDTTKEIGIPRTFHDIPVLFACDEYAQMNSMHDKAREIELQINKRSLELKEHLAQRQKDEQDIITSETIISI